MFHTALSLSHAARLDSIVAAHGGRATELVQILRDAQAVESWLPPATITFLAFRLKLPRARVEGVAGFYAFLHLEPAGRYRVLFSDNITDRMAGNLELLDRLCTNLWMERGKVSEDGLVSVDTTSCTGMCDQGPAILVNGRAIPRMTAERVDQMAELIREQVPLAQWPAELFAIEDNIHRSDILLDATMEPGDAVRAAIAAVRANPSTRVTSGPGARASLRFRRARRRRWRRSSAPTCAGAAARVLRPGSSGKPAVRRRARRATWSAMPTRASPERSRTGCCSRVTPTWCSRA